MFTSESSCHAARNARIRTAFVTLWQDPTNWPCRLTGLAGGWLLAEEPAGQDRGVIDELCCGVALQHADGHEQRQAGERELHTEPHH